MNALKNKSSKVADDDRNLVLVDRDFSEADLDDRLWLFWERRRGALIAGAVALIALASGLIVNNAIRASRAEERSAEYAAAGTPELKMKFAAAHPDEPVAALAALEAADDAYAKKDYKTAVVRYDASLAASDSVRPRIALTGGRALIGAAVSLIRSGDSAGGEKRLDAVAKDVNREDAVRAHALFLLAENACGRNDFAAAKGFLDRMEKDIPGATRWNAPGGLRTKLIDEFPELLAVTEKK